MHAMWFCYISIPPLVIQRTGKQEVGVVQIQKVLTSRNSSMLKCWLNIKLFFLGNTEEKTVWWTGRQTDERKR